MRTSTSVCYTDSHFCNCTSGGQDVRANPPKTMRNVFLFGQGNPGRYGGAQSDLLALNPSKPRTVYLLPRPLLVPCTSSTNFHPCATHILCSYQPAHVPSPSVPTTKQHTVPEPVLLERKVGAWGMWLAGRGGGGGGMVASGVDDTHDSRRPA